MNCSKKMCQFYESSYGKILILCEFKWRGKFNEISENGWFHWFHEIYDRRGKMHSSCHEGNFYCNFQNFYFLCISVHLIHIMHSGPLTHLVVSSCEYFTLLDRCIVLWSSDDRNPWLATKEVQGANVGGGRAWKVRNTKYSPGDFVFYGNASLFNAI